MARVKEINANWIVHMVDYIDQNPQFIVNGFIHAGITGALDGKSDESDAPENDSDEDHNENEAVNYIVLKTLML